MFTASMVDKGKGSLAKGNIKGLGKGIGRGGLGKGKGGEPPEPKSEAQQLAEAYTKAKKMRDFSTTLLSSMSDCIQVARKSKYWSKNAQKDADDLMAKLENEIAALKKVLLKDKSSVDELKCMVLHAAEVVKECQTACREYRQVANKAGSSVSSGSRKK